ncbi:MAG: molybdopterin oxidoreductase family protein [Betaproteobacteria bacterium]|nr:molybdopterin oxidoreductase family protein [Betaproteobacteria bacterium]
MTSSAARVDAPSTADGPSALKPLREVRAACPHDCPDTCAIRVTVQDDRVLKLQGDPNHPMTHGALCTKVSRYVERVEHADRVLGPLRRVGPKGSGQFVAVSWDEALDEIATRLKAIAARDPQAILPYSYAGTMGLVQGESMAARFFHRLGASLLDRTICASAGAAGLTATYGGKVGMHTEHFAQSKLILRTETADKCHRHLAIRPGTDGALALALARELIVRDELDHAYIREHLEGFEVLRDRAMPWTLERAAAECGVALEDLRELARDYGAARHGTGAAPAAIRLNYGMQRVHGGGNAVRLVALLPCLIGAWRHAGGGMLLSSSGWFAPVRRDQWLQRPDLLAGRRTRTINMSTIGDDLLRPADPEFGPRIEAIVVYNSNPVAVAPESSKVVRGFQREDLFTVVLEHFLTDTADQADYVLPATTQLEHWDVHTSYGHTDVVINEPALRPRGQARSNAQIFRDLAQRMGFDDPCFQDDDETLARGAVRGIDFAALRQQGWQALEVADAPFAQGGFPTPSGRARVASAEWGVPDYIPNHESAASTPELAQRYPLAMISPPARNFLNSTFVNVRSLRDIEGEPLVEMHPDDAAARSLLDGQTVCVFNDRGRYHCRLRVSTRARPGVVNGLGIWWRKLGLRGTNVNEVTHQRLTDLGRAPTFYDCLVEVGPGDALDAAD